MKQTVVLLFLVVGSTAAFNAAIGIPSIGRAFSRPSSVLRLSEESGVGGKLVPIKEETVEFTAGIIGGAVGFAVGGPVLGALTAAFVNYASKSDEEVGVVVTTVSKSSIQIYNYLTTLDDKYKLLNKAQGSLEAALEKLKAQSGDNSATIAKVESALASTTGKIGEINEEYDLVGTGVTALGVVGDLVEKAITKAGEINDEYKLTDKALATVSKAVETAKASI